jgi:P pilus assembly protein, pilin FimA
MINTGRLIPHKVLMTAALLAAIFVFSVSAGTNTGTVTVNVTVLADPCIINQGQPISVDFGDGILTTSIDGNNYQKVVEYTLDCRNALNSSLTMTLSGAATTFDDSILQTNITGLGIMLLSDDKKLPINSALPFNASTTPIIKAVPVKAPGVSLSGGPFVATAVMTVDYE